MKTTVLIVDDEPMQLRINHEMVAQKLGYNVIMMNSGQEAIDYVLSNQEPQPDIMLLDLAMPGVDGMEVLRSIRPSRPHLPIIVLTVHDSIERAVDAIRVGATDFLSKPVGVERLQVSLQNALRLNMLNDEVIRLQRNISGETYFFDLIGASPSLKNAISMGQRAAASHIPVLLEGESGVGKELFARAIHGTSDRAGKPFIAINCGEIPEHLAESILFGHEKGAFTGAMYRTIGKFREAEGGTIFLNDIGELKPELQIKLLRVLQTGEIEPVGGKGMVKVNVRLISATSRKLEVAVRLGDFREDLFYRLNVFPVTIPPLRERGGDVGILAEHFLHRFAALEHKHITGLSPAVREMLAAYNWPGNIRQLENAMFRAVVLADKPVIDLVDFQKILASNVDDALQHNEEGRQEPEALPTLLPILDRQGHVRRLEEMEEEIMRFALGHYDGHMSEVARRLGIGRSTLYRKVDSMALLQLQQAG